MRLPDTAHLISPYLWIKYVVSSGIGSYYNILDAKYERYLCPVGLGWGTGYETHWTTMQS